MPIQAALFFDNDLEYCNTFSPWAHKITPFHIGGYQRAEGEPFPIKLWDEMAHIRPKLTQEGKFVFDQLRFLTAAFPAEGQGDSYDETAGITFSQAQVILYALERKAAIHGAENVAAIFDFDRTLSMFEGLIGGNHESIPENSGIQGYLNLLNAASPIGVDGVPVLTTPAGLIDYLFGGPERVAWLHTLLHTIQTREHPLVILTNNSTAIRNPQLFKDFFPGQQDYISVICGAPYEGHKPRALYKNPAFRQLFQSKLPVENRYIIRFSRDVEHAPLLHVEFTQGESVVLEVNQLFPLPELAPVPMARRRATRKRRNQRKN
jgi:hypothetical protein